MAYRLDLIGFIREPERWWDLWANDARCSPFSSLNPAAGSACEESPRILPRVLISRQLCAAKIDVAVSTQEAQIQPSS
jgi:hypothetical protein